MLVTLGDYVNRGPDTCAVLDWLIEYQKNAKLVALRGNHEIMMLRARESEDEYRMWIESGGDRTLASYSTIFRSATLGDIPERHWDFLEQKTRRLYQTKTHFFVHASAFPDCTLEEQPDFMLFWEFFNNPAPHESGKIMVCGHSSQKSGLPLNIGHAVCIDTWACGGGWLTCLDVGSAQYWQANERGETRTDWLDNPVARD
ncbi:MAG TPA: metallophosphoesterase [Pirellulales bacterium]